ncbi:unnamed protein product, partial [Meganyctiphanes norvegica]
QIDHYNKSMGAVDLCDQLLQPYSSGRRSLAWFKKFGLHMNDRMTLNAYKLYKNTRGNNYKKTSMEFNTEVASQLLKKYNPGAKTIIEKREKFIKDRRDARLATKRRRQQAERAAAVAAAGADQAGRVDPPPPVARPA